MPLKSFPVLGILKLFLRGLQIVFVPQEHEGFRIVGIVKLLFRGWRLIIGLIVCAVSDAGSARIIVKPILRLLAYSLYICLFLCLILSVRVSSRAPHGI